MRTEQNEKTKPMVILDGYSECGSVDDIRLCKENFHGVAWEVSYNDRVYCRYKSHRGYISWNIFGVTDRFDISYIITSDYYINNEKPEEWSYYTTGVAQEKSERLKKEAELENIFQSLISETMRDTKLNYAYRLWRGIWIKIKSSIFIY
jgi:hypothetical protein